MALWRSDTVALFLPCVFSRGLHLGLEMEVVKGSLLLLVHVSDDRSSVP